MSDDSSKIHNGISSDDIKFDEFPDVDYKTWRIEAEKNLKGSPFEKILISETYEGIHLQPIYWQKDTQNLEFKESYPGTPPYVRGSKVLGYGVFPWEIAQKLPYATPQQFSQAIAVDLNNGQTSFSMKLDKASKRCLDPDAAEIGQVGRNGTSVATLKDLETLFHNFDLTETPIHIKTGASALPFATLLFGYLKNKNLEINRINCNFKADPIGELAALGELPISLNIAFEEMALLAVWVAGNKLDINTIAVDSSIYHNSGASAVEELAFAIATGLEYIRSLEKKNLSVDNIAGQMTFIFSIGPQFFMEIAKLRAARMLWSKVVGSCGGDEHSQKMIIHSKTSYYNKTGFDSNVNMLRTTTEAFSAVAGGCDSLHVGYFDETIKQPDEFSRRFARNIQIILKEESHFDKVIDPAGGSWYVESLTNQLALKAWQLFQEIETGGGMLKSLQDGFIQQRIEAITAKREQNTARRKDVFIGTSIYPDISEKAVTKHVPDYKQIHSERMKDLIDFRSSIDSHKKSQALEDLFQAAESSSSTVVEKAIDAAANGATLAEIARAMRKGDQEEIKIYPLKIQRGAEMFEVLRKAAKELEIKTGRAAKVFLACFGNLSDYKPRENFARDIFHVGGFETISYPAEGIDHAVKAAIDSQASAITICADDKDNLKLVSSFAKAIKQKKAGLILILAQNPGDRIEVFRKAGIDEFIYTGANIYELLVKISRKIGVLS